jgi:hypothetical protein
MSTRATYTLKSLNGTNHFYGHYDGYPQGAADYLNNAATYLETEKALSYKSKFRGSLPEAFIRANSLIQFTTNPNDHGDTEFHYIIEEKATGVKIRAFEHTYDSDWNRSKKKFFEGTLADFIAKYLGA